MAILLVTLFLKGRNRDDTEKSSVLLPLQEISEISSELSQLSVLLEERKWRMADEKTEELLLISAGRYREGWLDRDSINQMPCESFVAIDTLWESHTNGHFSFKKQREIWSQIATDLEEFDNESYRKFGQSVGWYSTVDERWLPAGQLRFSLESPPGHLPSGGKQGVWFSGAVGINLLNRCYS